MVQPESPAALLTCLGRHTAAHPPAADGPPAYPESGPAEAPGDLRFGCPEPCTRQANPPEHQSPISDLQSSTCARCASRPDFGLGGWRPQVQNLGRDRLRPFGRGRGWGKVSRPPHWKRANLATRRARGRQVRRSISQDRTFPWRGDAYTPRDPTPSFPRSKPHLKGIWAVSDRPSVAQGGDEARRWRRGRAAPTPWAPSA